MASSLSEGDVLRARFPFFETIEICKMFDRHAKPTAAPAGIKSFDPSFACSTIAFAVR
jgi:hypothetical protein